MSKVRETQELERFLRETQELERFVKSLLPLRWPSVSVPPWVPAAARNYLEESGYPKLPNDKEPPRKLVIARRLVTDPRMRNAWGVLGKLQDHFIGFFLHYACGGIPAVMTVTDHEKDIRALSSMAAACRDLVENDCELAPDDAETLARAADILDAKAREAEEMDSWRFVKNRTKDDEARAYVRMIGGAARRIEELRGECEPSDRIGYRTIATVATVALERPVNWQQVRNVCTK